MASTIYVDKLDPQSGTALEIGTSGDTITVPSGATFNVAGTLQSGGAAVANTPAFFAKLTSDQSISNDTETKAALATEVLDSDGKFDTSNYRFTPGTAGYYMLIGQVYMPGCDDGERIYQNWKINGNTGFSQPNSTTIRVGTASWSPGTNKVLQQQASCIVYMDSDDYAEWYIAQSSGDSQSASNTWTWGCGIKVIGA
jgi:hypothetical protein